MCQNENSSKSCVSSTTACVPLECLRERLEKAADVLKMCQHATDDIAYKLFSPSPGIEGGKNGPEYDGNEMEFLIEKVTRIANALELKLVSINDKL